MLEVVEQFPYLRTHLSQKATIETAYAVPADPEGNCAIEPSINKTSAKVLKPFILPLYDTGAKHAAWITC